MDKQGDFADADEIEKACHGFMRRLQTKNRTANSLGKMHKSWEDGLGDIVECYCAPADFEIDGTPVKKGTWLMGVVWSDNMFQKVQNGELTGYSMGGSGKRIEVSPEDGPQEFAKNNAGGGPSRFEKALAETVQKIQSGE